MIADQSDMWLDHQGEKNGQAVQTQSSPTPLLFRSRINLEKIARAMPAMSYACLRLCAEMDHSIEKFAYEGLRGHLQLSYTNK